MKKILKWFGVVFGALLLAFIGWDYYMRTTWDDHMVTTRPSSFSLKMNDGNLWKKLGENEI